MFIPDAEGDLVSGSLGAQGRKGGTQELGHLRLGYLVSGDTIVELFCCRHTYLPPAAVGRAVLMMWIARPKLISSQAQVPVKA